MKEYTNRESNNLSQDEKEWEYKVNNRQQYEQQKGFHPFYIFPFMYVISLYFILFFVFIWQEDSENSPLSYFVYLPILFGILNIIASIIFCKPENRIMMLNAAVLVKYTTIPFFMFGGFIWILSLFMTFIPVPFMIFMGPMIAAMIVAIGWIILVLESPYVISYLHLSSKEKVRPGFMTVLHIILQFFFVIDVFDVMFLTIREKKWRKLTIGIIVLLVICTVIISVRVLLGIFGILS